MALGSAHFSCGECAAAPRLPVVQGCWEDTPKPFARFGGHEFTRCPLTYQSPRGATIIRDVAEGALKELGYTAKMAMPAKRLAAMRYVERLIGEGDDGDGT